MKQIKWTTIPLVVSILAVIVAGLFNLRSRSAAPLPQTAVFGVADVVLNKSTEITTIAVGSSFEVNIADALQHLNSLQPDERIEQIADWATYSVLARQGADAERTSQWAINHPPTRVAGYETAANYTYGPGRAYVAEDNVVWLLYSADQPKIRTLAQLADRLRAETGTQADQYHSYRYTVDLTRGVILVDREPDISGDSMFSTAFGYVQNEIVDRAGLAEFLTTTQDLTYVDTNSGLKLGGRSFSDSPLVGATMDDVAVLYQAQIGIQASYAALDKEWKVWLEKYSVLANYSKTIDAYNDWVAEVNSDTSFPTTQKRTTFFIAASSLTSLLQENGIAVPEFQIGLPSLLTDLPNRRPTELVLSRNRFDLYRASEWLTEVERHASKFQNDGDELYAKFLKTAFEAGRVPPSEPGFSLDPQWDKEGGVADLEAARDDLLTFINNVTEEAESSDDSLDAPRNLTYKVAEVPGINIALLLNLVDLDAVASELGILAEKIGDLNGSVVDEQFLAFYEAKDKFTQNGSGDANYSVLNSILELIEARNRMQCARYDGDLQGTAVGMNLFYTDVLAKLWAGLDFGGKSPVRDVLGFRHLPGVSSTLDPVYFEEGRNLPGTRLWFGHRPSAIRHKEGELWFQPTVSRIYAAGNNPLNPGQETVASEASLRVFNWWDRYYQSVADHEPAFHRQNQIMKWSIVTGLLADGDHLPSLQDEPVDRSLRFDTWYAGNSDLRFNDNIYVLPEEEWLGSPKTECMEVLTSYPYESLQGIGQISGGVSLSSKRALVGENKLDQSLPAGVSGLSGKNQARGSSYRTFQDSEITLKRSADGTQSVSLKPRQNQILRKDDVIAAPRPLSINVHHARGDKLAVTEQVGGERTSELQIGLNDGAATLSLRSFDNSTSFVSNTARNIKEFANKDRTKTEPKDFTDTLALSEPFRPSKEAIIVEAESGALQLFQHTSQNTARGPPNQGVTIESTPAKPADLTKQVNSEGGVEAARTRLANGSLDIKLMENLGLRTPQDTAVAAKFQSIRIVPNRISGELQVARVFRNGDIPELASGKPIKIATGRAELPELELVKLGNEFIVDQRALGVLDRKAHGIVLDIAKQIEKNPQRFLDEVEAGTVRLENSNRSESDLAMNAEQVVAAARSNQHSSITDFLKKAQANGELDKAVASLHDEIAADVAATNRQGVNNNFLGLAAKRPAQATRKDVELSENILAAKTTPNNTDALNQAYNIVRTEPSAAGGGRNGGGGNGIGTFNRFLDPPDGPRRGTTSTNTGSGKNRFLIDMNGYRPNRYLGLKGGIPENGVSNNTAALLAHRVERSGEDTLLLIHKDLEARLDNLSSDQVRVITGLRGIVPEAFAGPAIRALNPAEIRLIIADQSSPLRQVDGIKTADGDTLISLRIKGQKLPPPPGGIGPPPNATGGPQGGPDNADAILLVLLDSCDLDGDEFIDKEEERLCAQDALELDDEKGIFIPRPNTRSE